MKSSHLYACFCLALSAILWMASSSGAANVQNVDLTRSPISAGTCANCHSGGNYSPSVTAQLLDAGTPVTQYQPGKTYTFRVRIDAANNPRGYGFQAVALTGSNNVNAGTFGTAPTGFRRTTLSGRVYIEHSSPRTSNTMDFSWTAPATATENVRFYASGLATNNSGGDNGDSPAFLSEALVITPMVTSVNDVMVQRLGLKVNGNPIGEALRISLNNPEAGQYRFSLYAADGRRVWDTRQWLQGGENDLEWDMPALPRGSYVLAVESRLGRASLKVSN